MAERERERAVTWNRKDGPARRIKSVSVLQGGYNNTELKERCGGTTKLNEAYSGSAFDSF